MMPLQYRYFMIPAGDSQDEEEKMNRFIRSVKVVKIKQKFSDRGEGIYWCVSVEYIPDNKTSAEYTKNKEKIDYKEILSPDDFEIFSKLRDWRKKIAERDGVPLYNIFKNAHLAKIAEDRIVNKTELKKLEGIGENRVKKYGEAVIHFMEQEILTEEKRTEK